MPVKRQVECEFEVSKSGFGLRAILLACNLYLNMHLNWNLNWNLDWHSQSNRIAFIGVIREMAMVGSSRTSVTIPRVIRLRMSTISQCQLMGTKLI